MPLTHPGKEWMVENRKSKGYNDGVNLFIQFAKNNYGDPPFCPCKKCRNVNGLKSLKDIRYHIFLNGKDQSYTTWCFHGEVNDEIDNTDIEDVGISSSIPLNDVGQTRKFDLVNDALGRAPLEGLNDYTDNVRSNNEVPEEDMGNKYLREDASRLIYPMKHKKYLDEQLRASRGRGARSKVKPMGFIPWLRMSISSRRRSKSSDQMEDSSNLAPQRGSTSPGLLRKRKALTLNEVGQAVGDKSAKFSTRIGEIAREHILIYIPTWKSVSNDTKMLIWISLSNEYELPLAAKDQVLIGANIAWKNKKCELRNVYDKYPTDDARKRNCPARTIQEDWERYIRILYLQTEIKSNVEKNPESKHYDVDDDPVGQAYGLEIKGRVRGEDAEVSGRRGMFFCDIPVSEWFKYSSFLLKIIDEVNMELITLLSVPFGYGILSFDLIGTCLDELEEDCQDVRDATNRCNEILNYKSEYSSKGCTTKRNLHADPEGYHDGYDLVVVDTMHKANCASQICHSGHPNCEAKVTVVDGVYQIGAHTVCGIRDSRGDEFVTEDEVFNCTNEECEWGARMMMASLIPPVTRKYEVIDQYVIIADEKEVEQKMQVSLPEDYDEKLLAQKNGNEDMDIPEVYPMWKWFQKQDGIRSLQKYDSDTATKFYNIYLERPKGDCDGYDLVVADAMHKDNFASQICHSCCPNCEAKKVLESPLPFLLLFLFVKGILHIANAIYGVYQIGVHTVRLIGYGEDITFDCNSVTESKEEYKSSICLCDSQVCRGSYLNLTGKGVYQKVLKERHRMFGVIRMIPTPDPAIPANPSVYPSFVTYSTLFSKGLLGCLTSYASVISGSYSSQSGSSSGKSAKKSTIDSPSLMFSI
ncbi:hypothetical protein GIB67_006539 [Kingdonia uniflora]|uniref:Transposase-associated domain-containing protein n=1 Tax=Kingdonia uniflora TaxID=39325 RepID=A0A7J7LF06_9MAGN|nr:hypothetical protein GIB67_006539 [Kingdonia uniflora]